MTDQLIGKKVNVLDQGWIELVDMLPHPTTGVSGDLAIVNAARVSFLGESKGTDKDKKLLFYLLRNRHCYHPEMEVLTVEGWKRWCDCNEKEIFLVPDPETRTLIPEELPVECFYANEAMYSYENQRMSYCVTSGHRMFFQPKYQAEFSVCFVEDMPQWGHFDPLQGYSLISLSEHPDMRMWFVGFFLGDGSYASKNRIYFHLKKPRKQNLLEQCVKTLGLKCRIGQSATHETAKTYCVELPEFLRNSVENIESRGREKSIKSGLIEQLTPSEIVGLWRGLVDSDGSFRKDRPQIEFSSSSKYLLELFELLSALQGIDAHRTHENISTAYIGGRTSLESRKEYHSRTDFEGNVFCTTTSTGFLMVRGGKDKFAFVCGNTSPFEMVEFKFRLRCPLVTWWQLVRHRTLNLNLQSGRYSPFEENDFYAPSVWRKQSSSNKQASEGEVDSEVGGHLTKKLLDHYDQSYKLYEEALEAGVSKELARLFLPAFSVYYTGVIKTDAHNMMHLLKLRMAPEAQYEIRVYAQAIYEHFFKPALPWTAEAFEQYILGEK